MLVLLWTEGVPVLWKGTTCRKRGRTGDGWVCGVSVTARKVFRVGLPSLRGVSGTIRRTPVRWRSWFFMFIHALLSTKRCALWCSLLACCPCSPVLTRHFFVLVCCQGVPAGVGAPPVPRHAPYSACAASRLPRVPERLPPELLRRHPSVVHSAAQSGAGSIPPQHAPSRPLHPEPQGVCLGAVP